ncbi:hypothetical protein CWB99_12465 [Pseudoalteromonas rubra]|uniref:Solute-binding protein family 3/N-terminal domain-containing protein n=1 Tax=Pseudoalteromonas rubra TaxID=43658 RepID=A0A5S3WKR9_9GAMM|nr:hypothetical protein [Pseudoalteromonas rubra]TMP28217.1 hypothetical protein CWB99_12465 [Pseudoalteromonas rubra]TMP34919.1 hypothetical protein CWC00_06095 [Pseudoalteromonas rubra]
MWQRILWFFGATLIASIFTSSHSLGADLVRYNVSKAYADPKQDYYIAVLRLALNKSRDKYGPYQLSENSFDHTPQGRTLEILEQGKLLDVHWTMTSQQRETQLAAVYVPLLKGMMGARIFLAHKDILPKLNQLHSPAQLMDLFIGSGIDWPDTKIYEKNGFIVVTSVASLLPRMLEEKRFELFPRALHEPWAELPNLKGVVVEPRFAFCYPTAMYFFVNKHNTRLKARLTYGLQKAIDDGSFNRLFVAHPITRDAIRLSKFNERQTLKLQNPELSARTRDVLMNARYVWAPLHRCLSTI